MAIGRGKRVLRELHTLFAVGAIGELTDGQLLERFATDRGEAAELAFEVLVERHGPMVLRVCRGVLADSHEAQDAFQATFLVLVGKARTLWVRDSLGPWLHQVAYRTAVCARSAAARRRRHEQAAAERTKEGRVEAEDELGRVLHEEIERLPERFRAPLVLCDLEGGTHEQAARHLGWPVGTVKSRLARGRDRLRDRLLRRGLAPGVWPQTPTLRLHGAEDLISSALAKSTTRVVVQFITSRIVLRESVAFLAQEVLRTMTMIRWLKGASLVLVLALAATAAGVDELARNEPPVAPPPSEAGAAALRDDGLSVIEVKPGRLTWTLAKRGAIEAVRDTTVLNKVEGRTTVLSILPEGTIVKKGELVCELDAWELKGRLANQVGAEALAERAYQKARLERGRAEIALAEYAHWTYVHERAALSGLIDAGRSAIQRTEARLERTRRARQRLGGSLAPKGENTTTADILAEVDLDARIDADEHALVIEKSKIELADVKRDMLEKYTRDKTIKSLEIEIESARADELARSQAWDRGKAERARLEDQVGHCKLYAPNDGPIEGLTEQGATVGERQRLFRVYDRTAPVRMHIWMPEAIVDQLQAGMRARIRADAFEGQVMSGVVESVAPLPAPPGRSRSDAKVYGTKLTIEDRLPGLRPGMTALAEIPIFELENVLSVPIQAVLRYDGQDHVAIKKPGGGFDWREVTLGQANDNVIEVKRGIERGEFVVDRPLDLMSEQEKRLKFGSPIRPTPPAQPPPSTRSAIPNSPAPSPSRP